MWYAATMNGYQILIMRLYKLSKEVRHHLKSNEFISLAHNLSKFSLHFIKVFLKLVRNSNSGVIVQ